MVMEAREAGTIDVVDAVTMLLRVLQERRRVLGLDAPVTVELTERIDDEAVMKAARQAGPRVLRGRLATTDRYGGERQRTRRTHNAADLH